MVITATGLAEQIAKCEAMGRRCADLSPVLRVIGAEIVRRTDDAFEQSRSPAGEAFPQLAESTRLARRGARELEGKLNDYDHRGELTPEAKRARARYLKRKSSGVAITTADVAVVYAKPMINSGRARASQRTYVAPLLLRWSAVKYLAPHFTGGQRDGTTGRPPKRNVSVFEHGGAGLNLTIFANTSAGWRMNDSMSQYARDAIVRYVQTGETKPGGA
jgi:hypothetical protein